MENMSKKIPTLKSCWLEIENYLTGKAASVTQLGQMRMAFFAGASAMMEIEQTITHHQDFDESQVLAAMNGVVHEMNEYVVEQEAELERFYDHPLPRRH